MTFTLLFRGKVFPAKCNRESVALDPVVDAEDIIWLQEILQEFKQKTGSKIAESILQTWPAGAKDFVKVSSQHVDTFSWCFVSLSGSYFNWSLPFPPFLIEEIL